jgi:hypothetical protein
LSDSEKDEPTEDGKVKVHYDLKGKTAAAENTNTTTL